MIPPTRPRSSVQSTQTSGHQWSTAHPTNNCNQDALLTEQWHPAWRLRTRYPVQSSIRNPQSAINNVVEWAGKPNSVLRVSEVAIIYLGRRSPAGSSALPTAYEFRMVNSEFGIRHSTFVIHRDGPSLAAYLGLLAVGFTLPRPSPATRCALTAPFHPYQTQNVEKSKSQNHRVSTFLRFDVFRRRCRFCGTFPRLTPG